MHPSLVHIHVAKWLSLTMSALLHGLLSLATTLIFSKRDPTPSFCPSYERFQNIRSEYHISPVNFGESIRKVHTVHIFLELPINKVFTITLLAIPLLSLLYTCSPPPSLTNRFPAEKSDGKNQSQLLCLKP